MLLTITTTHQPATDLGYLLHKHPARCQTFSLSFGQAHVFFPQATAAECSAALLLDVDPVDLIRGRGRREQFALGQYVNDRPYVASSFLSVAIAQVYGTALSGRSADRPELAGTAIPLRAHLSVIADSSGGEVLERLFIPLGYDLALERHPLDPHFPDWGQSNYFSLTLTATKRLADLLNHLYVLVPVLDNNKHYYVDREEMEKLLRKGAGWLADHPARELITQRYLRYKRSLTRAALARLLADESPDGDDDAAGEAAEAALEQPLSLHEERLNTTLAALKASGAHRVLDLGCGEGRLLQKLKAERQFSQIAGLDITYSALEKAARRLRLERLAERDRDRIQLWHGSLTYRDERLSGFDAAAVVEVIEHLDPPRLSAFERVLFEFARPATVVMTTPNAEYNVRFESLPAGQFRHRDHRFEWTRAEFQAWADETAAKFGYTVKFLPIGGEDPEVGAPSQMAVFDLGGGA